MKKLLLSLMLVSSIWYNLDDNTSYMQVPGGWIYRYISVTNISTGPVSMVFVPYAKTPGQSEYYIKTTPTKPR